VNLRATRLSPLGLGPFDAGPIDGVPSHDYR